MFLADVRFSRDMFLRVRLFSVLGRGRTYVSPWVASERWKRETVFALGMVCALSARVSVYMASDVPIHNWNVARSNYESIVLIVGDKFLCVGLNPSMPDNWIQFYRETSNLPLFVAFSMWISSNSVSLLNSFPRHYSVSFDCLLLFLNAYVLCRDISVLILPSAVLRNFVWYLQIGT